MSEQDQEAPQDQRPPIRHFQSVTVQGFFASDIHAEDQLPHDAVEMGEEDYRALFEGHAAGHPIIWGDTGPSLGPIPTPSPELVAENMRRERNARLVASDWSQFADVQEGMDEGTKTAWRIYRKALRDFPAGDSSADWPASPDGK